MKKKPTPKKKVRKPRKGSKGIKKKDGGSYDATLDLDLKGGSNAVQE